MGRFLRIAWLLAGALAPGALVAEDMLAKCRSLATNGHRPEALQVLEDYLQGSPHDPDARVLYGLVLSWEGRYDDARRQFGLVLEERRDYGDALLGLINVELWSGHADRADEIAADALTRRDKHAGLLFARARALKTQGRETEAVAVLDRLLEIDPRNKEALTIRQSLKESLDQWRVSLGHTYEWFNRGGGTWSESDMSLTRRTSLGSLSATFTRATRYDLHSNLAEINFYPRIRRGSYAYLGFGYSYDATLFPTYRLGGEIYQTLPFGMEGSGGYRRFGSADPTNLYTGSLGKYFHNWLLTTRVFVNPDAAGTTHSISFNARRFLGDNGDYLNFRFGKGPSPFDPRSKRELEMLKAASGYFEIRKTLNYRWMCKLVFGLGLEQRSQAVTLQHYLLQSTFYYRF